MMRTLHWIVFWAGQVIACAAETIGGALTCVAWWIDDHIARPGEES